MISRGTSWLGTPRFRLFPGDRIAVAGDSICVTGNGDGWFEQLVNESNLLYGDGITWLNHGQPGEALDTYFANGYAAAVVADAPNVIVMELGTNPDVGGSQSVTTTNALVLIDYWQAHLPGVRILVVGLWNKSGEGTPEANLDYVNYKIAGLQAAATARSLPYLDARVSYLAAQTVYNPSNVSAGITTLDGLHPNWRGRQLYGVQIRRNVLFANPTYAPPDWSAYTPATDVTPSLWIEADQLALSDGALVATWGPWSASGANRPTFQATGWADGRPTVHFSGSNVMTAPGLAVPAGAKTIFVAFKIDAPTATFAHWQQLATFKVGSNLFSRIVPDMLWTFNGFAFDGDIVGNPGNAGIVPTMQTQNVYTAEVNTYPLIVSATWNGGTANVPSNYATYFENGRDQGPSLVASSIFVPSTTTVNSLGARLDDGVTIDQPFVGAASALIVYPGVLTTVQRARVYEYLRRKWGVPPLP